MTRTWEGLPRRVWLWEFARHLPQLPRAAWVQRHEIVEALCRRFDPEGWAEVDEHCARAAVLVAHHREMQELNEAVIAELDAGVSRERALEIWLWLNPPRRVEES